MWFRRKKRILLLIITLFICGFYFVISQGTTDAFSKQGATSREVYCYINASEGIDETRILSRRMKKNHYLFLPSGIDLSALQIFFSCPEEERVFFQEKAVEDNVLIDVINQGIYDKEKGFYKLQFKVCQKDGSFLDYNLRIMTSENIPSVFLVSDDPLDEGREWVESTPDHTNVAKGSVYQLDETGNLICRQKAEKLRIRGNFTASAAKKAYQIKLSSKEDMLSIGEPRKDWALLANAYDTTLQHNTLSYQLGKELGLTDSPDCTPVDVYYDGEYMGNYLLTELPELSNTSVAIEENGSYFMQIDYSHYMERDNNLELSNGMYVTVEEPEKCSDEQIEYLKQLWEETIEALENGGTNPSTKKTVEDYLDLDTYARYYLVQQFAKNPDGFSSSTYCYVPSDEDKIYFCGLWDFDLCYGCDKQLLKLTSPIGYYPDNAGSDFSTVPVVSQKIKDVYENELKDIIEDILLKDGNEQGTYVKSLAAYNEEIYASQRMNYKIWDFNQTGVTVPFNSYEESVEYFKDYVEKRHQWLYGAVNSWVGNNEAEKVDFTVEEPLAGMPLEPDLELSDKWCGAKILSLSFVEQDAYFDPRKDYHYRAVLTSQLGSSFPDDLSVTADFGKVESQTMLENGMIEVILNTGKPKITNTVYMGVNYAPVYNKEYYLSHYPEVAKAVGTEDEAVLEYFVTQGMDKQHQGCEDFDVKVYIARYGMFEGWENPDIYMHYLTDGIFQEWSGKL